jgi:hypothetical protein
LFVRDKSGGNSTKMVDPSLRSSNYYHTASCTMPKRALGHLKNLGGYADRNAKKARLSAQKEEKENIQASLIDALFCFYLTSFQPNRNTSTGMPGIPFSNPSFSPPMHDLLDTTP